MAARVFSCNFWQLLQRVTSQTHTYKAWKMELDLSKKGAGIGGSGGVAG